MAGNHLGFIMGVGHDPADICPRHQIQRVVDQSFAGDLNQRFGPVLRQGLHAPAKTSRKQHQGVGVCGHAAFSLAINLESGAGRLSVINRAISLRSGWERSSVI